jgi:predicted acylesterase/phospholipase RssA
MKLYFFVLNKDILDKSLCKWMETNNFYLSNNAEESDKVFVFMSSWTYQLFCKTPDLLKKKLAPFFQSIHTIKITPDDRLQLSKRNFIPDFLLYGDYPTEGILEEVDAYLYTHPKINLYYLGRGHQEDYLKINRKLKKFEQVGRLRNYWWEEVPFGQEIFFERSSNEELKELCDWFRDDDARVVLSLGSGGLRLFSLSPFLQFLEEKKLISHLSEIWGCSGGAIAGYLLAYHVPSSTFQDLGYRIYENAFTQEESPFVENSAIWLKKLWQSGFFQSKSIQGVLDFSSFTQSLLQKAYHNSTNEHPLPFYTLAHNHTKKKNFVFSNREEPDYLKSFVRSLPGEPEKMVTASSAIPFLFKREPIVNEEGEVEEWCDGVLYEETPLATVLRKWHYDREHKPDETPKRLKIFYIDLGLKVSDVVPDLSNSHVFRYLDELWKKQRTSIEMLFEDSPNVEIQGIEMKLGFAGLLDPKKIPNITHRGYGVFQRELKRINDNLEVKKRLKKVIRSKKVA